MFDATELAKALMGDAIYSNMIIFGAAWQQGAIPVGRDAILRAIELNGTAVERNKQAFEYGRWAVLHPEDAAAMIRVEGDAPKSLDERIAFRAEHLTAYQDAAYALRYRDLLGQFDGEMKEAVAEGYHKLLAYKDEYEVARLLVETRAKAAETFDGDLKLTHHLSPPLLARIGPNGRPKKYAMPRITARLFPLLARLKRLRGTRWDIFGRTEERRKERALIAQYEVDMAKLLEMGRFDEPAIALARLPLTIRGFGPVKMAHAAKAAKEREALWAAITAPQAPAQAAE